jgi:hypothetical protein
LISCPSFLSLKRSREVARRCDVPLLRALVAAGEQDDERLAPLNEINPISGTVIDPQLRDAMANRPYVARIAKLQAIDAHLDATTCFSVAQAGKPAGEQLGLADFYRRLFVS